MITIERRKVYEEMKHELNSIVYRLEQQLNGNDDILSREAHELLVELEEFIFQFEEAFRLEDEEKEVRRTFEEWFKLAQAFVA